MPKPSRRDIHQVGLTASVVGLLAPFALAFATVSPNRVAQATALGALAAAPAAVIAMPVLAWVVALVASLRRGGRVSAFVRGIAAAAALTALVGASGEAAFAAVRTHGLFTRYSIGGGAWVSAFAAFALVMASRRELGIRSPAAWAVSLLAPAGIVALVWTKRLSALGIAAEYRNVAGVFPTWVWLHFAYSAVAVLIAMVLGVALGVLAWRRKRAAEAVFAVTSVFQTIPGLAMVGILVVPLAALGHRFPLLRSLGVGGLGWAPVVIALTLYALLAIVRNTYAALASVPPDVVEAARAMGMSGGQVLRRIELPLATPIIFGGARTASQQTISNATLGAFVAASTLGAPIFLGVAQQANDLVVLGSLALVALAICVDAVMRGLQHLVTPPGVQERGAA
jgi:osmoprotectant transport system permease protein